MYFSFEDFFEEYKKEFKKLDLKIPFSELPLHRKLFCVFVVFWGIVYLSYSYYKEDIIRCLSQAISLSTDVATLLSISSEIFAFLALYGSVTICKRLDIKKNYTRVINEFRKKCITNRNKILLIVLDRFGISMNDKDKLGWLIEEAEREQNDEFPSRYSSCLVGLLLGASKLYFEVAVNFVTEEREAAYLIILFCIFGIGMYVLLEELPKCVFLFVNTYFKRTDYYMRDKLIYDLRQLRIFGGDDNQKKRTVKKIIYMQNKVLIVE